VNASPRPAVASPSPDAASTSPATSAPAKPKKKKKRRKPAQQRPNNVRKLRQAAMMSKAELARRASVSPLTINRVENGWPCRMDTKRKILEALGLSPSAREEVFGPDPEAS
jgi:DNA-binding XRE family transcriptional regulator